MWRSDGSSRSWGSGRARRRGLTRRLPGESQKIDRLVEAFSQCYYEDNPHMFRNQDSIYVLAYATIMLNSDAHNPHVGSKMTLNDFIQNNRGMDDGHDFDRVSGDDEEFSRRRC